MYARGDGVREDDSEAFRWYRLAAEQGYANAQYQVGRMYFMGQGVLSDAAEAFRWNRRAAQQGHAMAQAALGMAYGLGRGVREDYVLAHMWFNIAGANGEETARAARLGWEALLSPAQIRRAADLARQCMASDYRNCGP